MTAILQPAGYLGEFAPGDVVNFAFSFRDATGAYPAAVTTGDCFVFDDADGIAPTPGVTVSGTLGAAFGLGRCHVNTAADSGYYIEGHDYFVVLNSGWDVDGVDPSGSLIAHFSLGNRYQLRGNPHNKRLLLDSDGRAFADCQRIGGDAIQQAGGFVKISDGVGAGQVQLTGGYVGINWGDVANPTTALNLANTTIKAANDHTADLADIEAALVLVKAKTDLLPTVPGRGIKANTEWPNFPFSMRSSVDHITYLTGLTVTATRSIDGGAFAACANAPTEVGGGLYSLNLAASDLNGVRCIIVQFAAAGADTQRVLLLLT